MKEILTGGSHIPRPMSTPYSLVTGDVTRRFTTRSGSRYHVLTTGSCIRDKADGRWINEVRFRRDRECDRVLFINPEDVARLRKAVDTKQLAGIEVTATDVVSLNSHPVLLLNDGQKFWQWDGTTLRFIDPGSPWGWGSVHVGSKVTQLDVTPAQ